MRLFNPFKKRIKMPDLTKEIKKANDAVIDAWGKGYEQGLKEGKEIKIKEAKE